MERRGDGDAGLIQKIKNIGITQILISSYCDVYLILHQSVILVVLTTVTTTTIRNCKGRRWRGGGGVRLGGLELFARG